jgi:hypothetical protein
MAITASTSLSSINKIISNTKLTTVIDSRQTKRLAFEKDV